MKFLTTLLCLLLCMLLAGFAFAGDPLDSNDGPALHRTSAVLAAAPGTTLERPDSAADPWQPDYAYNSEHRFTGDPTDANDGPSLTMTVWVPNVGLVDLFWWLRK